MRFSSSCSDSGEPSVTKASPQLMLRMECAFFSRPISDSFFFLPPIMYFT